MQFDEIKDFQGLFIQPNSFNLPTGALEIAKNVVIEDKSVISKTRGAYTYYTVNTDEEIVGLVTFNNRLIAIYKEAGSGRADFFLDGALSPNFVGVPTAITPDSPVEMSFDTITTPKFDESNSNLYFTSDDGVLKLTEVSSLIYQAGAPMGLDIGAKFTTDQPASFWATLVAAGGAFPNAITIGYRVLFGYTDSNNNLIIGAPSSTFIISNPVVNPLLNTNNVPLVGGGGPYTITVDSQAHGLVTGQTIKVIGARDFTDDANALAEDGVTITRISDDQFSYDVPNNPGVFVAPATSGNITYVLNEQVRLNFSIPSQISGTLVTGWFFQLYRSSQSAVASILSDFKLIEEKQLTAAELRAGIVTYTDDVSELNKGAFLYTNTNSGGGEIIANHRPPRCHDVAQYQKRLFFANCKPREFLDFAVIDANNIDDTAGNTSPESDPTTYIEIAERLGEEISKDLFICRRYYWPSGWASALNNGGNPILKGNIGNWGAPVYASLRAVPTSGLPFKSCDGPIKLYLFNVDPGGSTISKKMYYCGNPTAATARMTNDSAVLYNNLDNFIADTGVPYVNPLGSTNYQVISQCVESLDTILWTSVGDTVTMIKANHGYARGLTIWFENDPNLANGLYQIDSRVDANTFTITATTTAAGGSGQIAQHANVVWKNNTATSEGIKLRDVAEHLVQAINHDPFSSVYAQYTSTLIDNPGFMRLYQKDFTSPISLRVDSTTTSSAFGNQVIPTSYTTGLQVYSAFPSEINSLYFSNLQEPEAVPILNFVNVGSGNEPILAIHALTNSLIVIKPDGIFRLSGDESANFSVSLIDPTVKCLASNTSVVFNNQVALLSNQGICLISETGIQVISRPIENVIQYALDLPTLETSSCAFAYEVDRSLQITTLDPGDKIVNYLYNVLTDTWTNSDRTFGAATLGPDGRMYYVSFSDNDLSRTSIYRERKDNRKTDYSGEWWNGTILNSTDPDRLLIDSPRYVPRPGDLIPSPVLGEAQVNVIKTVDVVGSGRYYCTFFHKSNLATGLVPGDGIIIYEGYESIIKLAPYTAGQVGLMKQFSQMQIHFRDLACTYLDVSFSSDTYANSKSNEWIAPVQGWAWGTFAWGVKAWGAEEVDFLSSDMGQNYGTTYAHICRMYVSRLAQRSTFFQPIIKNRIGGDKLNIQSVNVALRKFGERVSR
tara:strand:- start:2197 stop:5730 length:3534 start_codon:yes stop_codon:yes gene_type:complete